MDIVNQRKYLVETLGKQLADIDIAISKRFVYIDGKEILAYRALAMMLWPNEFIDGKRKVVHHIDGDRTNNHTTNLVVLTYKEHKLIHKLFDETYREGYAKQSATLKKKFKNKENHPTYGKRGKDNPRYGIRGEIHTYKKGHRTCEGYTWKIGPDGKHIYTRKELI